MTSIFHQWLLFVADNPAVRLMQAALLMGGIILIFLVFFATRDILLRTDSLLYQFLCILLVAVLPILGFLLYLLIRPARTLKERQTEQMLQKIVAGQSSSSQSSDSSESSVSSDSSAIHA